MRYRLDLCYDGAPFCGWQIQPDAPSVQGTLEDSLGKLLRIPTAVTGAGRTDTGVNASFYVAHFDAAEGMDCDQLRYKLNAILPKSIAIFRVSPVPDDFHARFGATKREYTYFLHRVKDPFVERYSYYYGYPEVDFDAMNRAAALLRGRRDFSCFEKSGGDNKTSICNIFDARWEPRPGYGPVDGYWKFTISADRFLRNMVRAIVGTLLEVGRGRRTPESMIELMETGDRCASGESVPGYALFLSDIEY